jgi:endonuclease I
MKMRQLLLLLLMFNFFLFSCDSGSSDDSAPDTDIEQPDQPDDDKNPDRENYLTPNVDSEGKIIVNYTPKEYVKTVQKGQHMISVRIPKNYYTSASTLKGDDLREELQEIISTGAIKLEYTSSSSYDVWDMCEAGDQNPADERQVWQIYTETGRAKNDHSAGVSDEWNREHVWAKSHGDFGTSPGAGTDGHHLRASYSKENSTRGNKNFADVNGARTYNTDFYEPPLSAKGDVARAIFYMAVRYGFTVDNRGVINSEARMGKLDDLLKWNELDPVDPYEIRRNNIIYDFQKNRNPFIDHPELVKYVFGDKKDAACKE